MRARAGVVAAPLLAALSLACRFGGAPHDERRAVPTATAERGRFDVTIDEVGVLRATSAAEIKAQQWYKVAKVVADGTVVKAGDPVIWMDTSEEEQQLARLDADLSDAESQMKKQLERMSFQGKSRDFDLAVSKANLDFEEKKLASAHVAAEDAARQRGLGLISQQAADRATEALRSAELSEQKTRLTHEQKVEQIASDRRKIEVERQQAQRTWAQTKERRETVSKGIAAGILRAPVAGQVFLVKQRFRGQRDERFVRVGDQVGPWTGALAQIPDLGALEVRSQVDEALVSRVAIGMPVVVRATAVEGLELKGRVRLIGVLAVQRSESEGAGFSGDKKGGAPKIVLPVTVEMLESDRRLQPGMTVGVSYLLQVIDGAVSIADDAVFGTTDKPIVFVRSGGSGYEERAVKLGPASHGRVVVTSGLEGGESIYLGDPREGRS